MTTLSNEAVTGSLHLSQDTSNRRRATRVSCEAQVMIRAEGPKRLFLADSRDISVNGMFVTTDTDLSIGTPCEINILLGGGAGGQSIKVKGKVVRKDKSGVGISFDSADLDSFMHLKNLVRYNADDPDAVEKETLV